jgi:DNA-binding NarL/FixJ family response regulator
MIRTELELAIRVTVDLSRPVAPSERTMLLRSVELARDVSALRGGRADPAVALVESHLRGLEAAPEPLQAPVAELPEPAAEAGLAPLDVVRRRAIVAALAQPGTFEAVARRLKICPKTLKRRMRVLKISDVRERVP